MYNLLLYNSPKFCTPNFSGKMAYANTVEPNQAASEVAVWSESTVFAIPPSILWYKHMKNKI